MARSGGVWMQIAGTMALMTAVALSAAATGTGGKKAKAKKGKVAQASAATASSQAAPAAPASSGGFWSQTFAYGTANPQGSLMGTPGLWTSQFAETLAPAQASASVYAQRYTRNPGAEVFTDIQAGWTIGITRWLELTFATTPYRRVRINSPEMLTFPSLGTLQNYNPVAPFGRNPLLHGPVDMTVGATIGLLNQDRGARFGLGVQVYEHIPYFQDYRRVVNLYGVDSGEPIFGVNVLADKYLGNAGEWVGNAGFQRTNRVDAGGKVDLQLRKNFTWSTGLIFPRRTRLQGIVEFNGTVPFGSGAHYKTFGPLDPVDATYGARYSPIPWMGFNAGYRLALNNAIGNSNGFVFGVSFGTEGHKVAPPTPVLTCQVDQSPVYPGAVVHISTTVTPQGWPYTYTWTAERGSSALSPNQGTATFNTSGLAPGVYGISVRVDNGQGGYADCRTTVEVRLKPKPPMHPPVATCSAQPDSVHPGATVTLTANASSPDDRPLSYAWTVTGGKLETDNQASVQLDTTGVPPGTIQGEVTVTDDRGLATRCTTSLMVHAAPPPPQASLATVLDFLRNSARVNNVSKAALDDVALRLEQDATAHAVIVGFAAPDEGLRTSNSARREASLQRLAEDRARNAQAYLVKQKGIDAGRIELREDHSAASGHKAEVWVVPQGATYSGSGQPF